MKSKIAFLLVHFVLLFAVTSCSRDEGTHGEQTIKGWDLTPSDHEQVMQLLRKIYKAGIGDRIVAWYETEARGYFDMQEKELVEFQHPIRTLSVAIPDYVSHTEKVQSKLEQLASTTSHNGWKLKQFVIKIDLHGAGGGPSGSFDKVTIYPLEILYSSVGQSSPQRRIQASNSKSTALVDATEQNNVAGVKRLLSSGGDANLKNGKGDPVLLIAARSGNVEIVELLLANSAEVDLRNEIGTTPLFSATLNGNEQVVKILIANGADVDAAMPNGISAIEMAQLKGYSNIVRMLRGASTK